MKGVNDIFYRGNYNRGPWSGCCRWTL